MTNGIQIAYATTIPPIIPARTAALRSHSRKMRYKTRPVVAQSGGCTDQGCSVSSPCQIASQTRVPTVTEADARAHLQRFPEYQVTRGALDTSASLTGTHWGVQNQSSI